MKNYLIGAVLCFAGGFITSKYFSKPEVKIETVTVVKTKENTKVVKETRPDGTIVETKETTVEKDNQTLIKKENKKNNHWIVSVKKDLFRDSEWTGEIGRSIFRDLYITGYYRTDGVGGIGLTVTF
jgi:hypothetical protein